MPEGRPLAAPGSTESARRHCREGGVRHSEQGQHGDPAGGGGRVVLRAPPRARGLRPSAAAARREAGHIREEHATAGARRWSSAGSGGRPRDHGTATRRPGNNLEGHRLIYQHRLRPSTVGKVLHSEAQRAQRPYITEQLSGTAGQAETLPAQTQPGQTQGL